LTTESDPVNPSHYKQLPAETIDIIEAAIENAPSNKVAGLHWQVLKYALRCWFKNGIEDLKKARWYLDRLIQEEESK
jgi:DNA replication protein DnaD